MMRTEWGNFPGNRSTNHSLGLIEAWRKGREVKCAGQSGRALVSLATTMVAATLLAPAALASPIGDAEAAIMAAWDKAGGDTSPLGARKGDVYPVADGFALDFDRRQDVLHHGLPARKYAYGPMLDKYEALGGPGGERPGVPDHQRSSRTSWARQPGNHLLRQRQAGDLLDARPRRVRRARRDQRRVGQARQLGRAFSVPRSRTRPTTATWSPRNSAAVRSLGTAKPRSSPPTRRSWPTSSRLADYDRPTAAIGMAWRAAGGRGSAGSQAGCAVFRLVVTELSKTSPGGKVYLQPGHRRECRRKRDSGEVRVTGGPVASDLGFPAANETDGGIAPSSRVVTFSAADSR